MGSGSHDLIGVHRVVRGSSPGVPAPTRAAVMMVHGDIWGFDSAFAGEVGRINRAPNVASYLAESDIDVWGIDLRWVAVPLHTSDRSFMHSWGPATDVQDIRVATDMERAIRGATGSGYGRTALLGWSRGGPQVYAYASYETTLALRQRNVNALVPVDTLLRYAPEDDQYRLHSCQYWHASQAAYRSGVDAGSLHVTQRIGQAALLHPRLQSRFFPGLTNRQGALTYVGTNYGTFSPWYHFNAPTYDDQQVPDGLVYSPPLRIFGLLQHAASWESEKEFVTGYKIWCGRPDPLVSHVAAITVPVLYLAAAVASARPVCTRWGSSGARTRPRWWSAFVRWARSRSTSGTSTCGKGQTQWTWSGHPCSPGSWPTDGQNPLPTRLEARRIATMTSRIGTITFDCVAWEPLVEFWSSALDYAEDPDNPNSPGDPEGYLRSTSGGPGMLFIPVPEGKTVKNRVHLDIVPLDATRDEEVARLVSLGAVVYDDHRRENGTGFVVLRDPEGNELCVERSEAERRQPVAV